MRHFLLPPAVTAGTFGMGEATLASTLVTPTGLAYRGMTAYLRAAPGAEFRAPLHPPEVGAAIMGLRRLDDGDVGSWTLNRGKRRITRSLCIDEIAVS